MKTRSEADGDRVIPGQAGAFTLIELLVVIAITVSYTHLTLPTKA